MKNREGFVTNSSSSSFIVVKHSDYNKVLGNGIDLIIGEVGETEFGWSEHYYHNFYDKLNFAYMQTTYSNYDGTGWKNMLVRVLKESGFNNIFVPLNFDGYIDHASSATEGANTEMFDTEEALADFLFNEESYIRTDNDNH